MPTISGASLSNTSTVSEVDQFKEQLSERFDSSSSKAEAAVNAIMDVYQKDDEGKAAVEKWLSKTKHPQAHTVVNAYTAVKNDPVKLRDILLRPQFAELPPRYYDG